MPFDFIKKEIEDVVLIVPKKFKDKRGFFMETYKKSDFSKSGINAEFIQDNHSKSGKCVIRGLHYQINPRPQGKLVRVVSGMVLDVAVDIRKGSPTYGKWVSEILSAENGHMLWVPPGFAHGVGILKDNTELLYKVSNSEYSPEHERGILWNDPVLNIDWGIENPKLSQKDKNWPLFKNIDTNFIYEKINSLK